MIALLDGDIIVYRCAASAENDPLEASLERVDYLIDRIMSESSSNSHKAFLTGSSNFRKELNSEYKANRKDLVPPRWLQETREHLVLGWGATVSDGNEADDELGIAQCTADDETIICSIDKDLLQIPGKHFNFVKNEFSTITPHQGLQNFYYQMIMGDSSDNIFGFDGKARRSVPKFLEPTISRLLSCETEYDMYEYICDLYSEQGSWADDWASKLEMNAHCLYIQKKIGDKWQSPNPPDSNPA